MPTTPASSKPRTGGGRESPTSKKRGSGDGDVREDASPMDVSNDEICWICLEGEEAQGGSLATPCKCPRKAHPQCLARWQLQQAGRSEETTCRFCKSTLADWKDSLTPSELKPEVEKVQPIMVVYFEGEIHRIPVRQGDEGLKEFTARIRELFKLPAEVDISLTFGCKEPMSGHHLKLEGMGAFDAAVHCASVAAAERQHKAGQRAANGRADESSSDDGEDTTDLLQSTLGGPIQPPRNQRAAQPQQQQQRQQPAAHPIHRFLPGPGNRQQRQQQREQQANNNRHHRNNFPGFPQHVPATPRQGVPAAAHQRPPVQTPVVPVAANLAPMYSRFMPGWPADIDWRNHAMVLGAPMPIPYEAFMAPHPGMLAAQPTSWYPEIFQNRPGHTNAQQQPFGMYDGAGSSSQQTVAAGDVMHDVSMARNNARRGPGAPAGPMECDPRMMPSQAMMAAAQQLQESSRMPGSNQAFAVSELEMLEATAGFRNQQGLGAVGEDGVGPSHGDGRLPSAVNQNYNVPNGVISRSKLNQVLSFFGIKPPQQYTLGTNVQLDE